MGGAVSEAQDPGAEAQPVREARAVARFVRAAPRKVGIVCAAIRGKPVGEALAVLQFLPNRAAGLVAGVLRSAIANATHNYELDPELLVVAQAVADPGPMNKRIHPRARGRAFPILKRTTHITVVVRESEA